MMKITHEIRQVIFDIFCNDSSKNTKVEVSIIPPIANILRAKGTSKENFNKQAKILLVIGALWILRKENQNSWEDTLKNLINDELLESLAISESDIKRVLQMNKLRNIINQ